MKWLFLRGLLREQRHWGNFLENFQKSMGPGLCDGVVCLDLPGMGTEKHQKSPYKIQEITQNVRERFESLRAEDPKSEWAVFSMSLGAMVALDWCAQYPETFKAAVVINTSAKSAVPIWKRMRPHTLKVFGEILLEKSHALREKKILALTSKTQDPRTLAVWSGVEATRKELIEIGLPQIWAAANFEMPAQVHTPTLVLCGLEDDLVHPNASLELAKKLNLDLAVHVHAGHDLAVDDPAWVIDQTRSWVRQKLNR